MTTTGAIEQAVLAATQRWLDATVSGDVTTLDELVADDYTFTHATTANQDTREEWLESFRSGNRRYKVWQIADVSVRLYPGTAVMTGRGHQEIIRPNGDLVELNTRFLSVWVEQDGRWRLVAWQATRLPDAS